MKIDTSRFKKVSSDGQCTVLRNDDGHEFKVVHKALSPKMRSEINKLPQHMDEGGEVQPAISSDPLPAAPDAGVDPTQLPAPNAPDPAAPDTGTQAPPDAPDASRAPASAPVSGDHPFLASLPNWMFKDSQNPYAAAQAAAPIDSPSGPAPASAAPPAPGLPPNQPQGAPDPMGAAFDPGKMLAGLGEQKAGLRQEAVAQGNEGKAEAAIAGNEAQSMQEMQKNYQDQSQKIMGEYQNLQADYQKQAINPNHYMESMSSGQKVSTAVGLILSGFGSGMSGQQNLAEQFLRQQIDRDVAAQQANMGKSENLLKYNMQQFGNLREATDMTKAMNMGLYSAQLKQAAAQSQDPMAKARALQAAGKLDTEAAPILQQLAVKKAAMQTLGSGQADPSVAIRFLVPEAQQGAAYKEMGDAKNMYKAKDNILGAFDQLSKINTYGNAVTSPMQTAKQVAAIKDPLVAGLSKETAGRFTEQDASYLGSLFPAKGDSDATIDKKRSQMNKLVSEKMHFPMLDAYGLSKGLGGRYADNGQNKLQLGRPVK